MVISWCNSGVHIKIEIKEQEGTGGKTDPREKTLNQERKSQEKGAGRSQQKPRTKAQIIERYRQHRQRRAVVP